MNQSFIVIIPARFASTRFPGKPLAKLQGKEMILHVAEKAASHCQQVFVATDDNRIADLVKNAGHEVIMTASDHQSGTERIAEAVHLISPKPDPDAIIVNLQGDEPFFPTGILPEMMKLFLNPTCQIATCIHPIHDSSTINNPNRVKVVVDQQMAALYFSRAPIPYSQSAQTTSYQHIGVYAYRQEVLAQLIKLPPGPLEKSESLEQLRWLENGYQITCMETEYSGFGIDAPEDLVEAEAQIRKFGL